MTRPEMKMEYVSYDRAKGREHMEEKNVMISITGLQKVDGVEQEPVELITPGVLSQVGGGYHLTYRETALTGLEGTFTSFQVYPDQVSMVRMGTVCLQMVFEKGRRHLSVYETPYGNMSVGVRTEQLTSTLGESGGVIDTGTPWRSTTPLPAAMNSTSRFRRCPAALPWAVWPNRLRHRCSEARDGAQGR